MRVEATVENVQHERTWPDEDIDCRMAVDNNLSSCTAAVVRVVMVELDLLSNDSFVGNVPDSCFSFLR